MHERKEAHGVGLAARESIMAGVDKGGLVVDCISARLTKVRININKRPGGGLFLFLIERQLGSTLANNLKQNVTCTSHPEKKTKKNTRSFVGIEVKNNSPNLAPQLEKTRVQKFL